MDIMIPQQRSHLKDRILYPILGVGAFLMMVFVYFIVVTVGTFGTPGGGGLGLILLPLLLNFILVVILPILVTIMFFFGYKKDTHSSISFSYLIEFLGVMIGIFVGIYLWSSTKSYFEGKAGLDEYLQAYYTAIFYIPIFAYIGFKVVNVFLKIFKKEKILKDLIVILVLLIVTLPLPFYFKNKFEKIVATEKEIITELKITNFIEHEPVIFSDTHFLFTIEADIYSPVDKTYGILADLGNVGIRTTLQKVSSLSDIMSTNTNFDLKKGWQKIYFNFLPDKCVFVYDYTLDNQEKQKVPTTRVLKIMISIKSQPRGLSPFYYETKPYKTSELYPLCESTN